MTVGRAILLIVLLVSLYGAGAAVAGLVRHDDRLIASARRAVYVVAG